MASRARRLLEYNFSAKLREPYVARESLSY